jgi:hypothetical protein
VLGPSHVVAGLLQGRRQLACLEIRLGAKKGKIEPGDLDAANLVSRASGGSGIGVGHRIQQVIAGRIRMALDDGNTLCH